MQRVEWEELRETDGFEKYFVSATRESTEWRFQDRSTFDCSYYSLPSTADLLRVAERGLKLDRPTGWFDLTEVSPEVLKERARRNRRIVGRLRVRYEPTAQSSRRTEHP